MSSSYVLYFSPHLPPDNMAAAVRGSVFLEALKKRGIEVHAITTTEASRLNTILNHEAATTQTANHNSTSGTYHSTTIKPASNKASFFQRFIGEALVGGELILRLIGLCLGFKRPSLVVLSSPPYITNWLASFGCQFCRIPYAIDARDLYPEVYFNQKLFTRDSVLGRMQVAMAQRFYSRSVFIFTVTEGCKKIIAGYLSASVAETTDKKEHAQPTAKTTPLIEVIRNGYVETDFQNMTAKKRSTFTCLFHGNLGLLQNIDLLKEVIEKTTSRAPDIQFLLAGSGPQEGVFKHIKHSSFHFLGEVTQKDIPALISSCHLGLSFRPTNDYTEVAFPVKIFEYIGAEIPTIATPPNTTIKEIATRGLGFLFENHEADKIVDKIIELATDSEKYNQVVAQIKTMKHEYSRTAGGEKFAQVIQKYL